MNDSGGHVVMNLMTGAKMTKPRVWEVPITETVIQAVESLAKLQGYKTLKLMGKNKTRLLPSDWDKDEEYVFDDSYDSDNDDEVDDEFENITHKNSTSYVQTTKITTITTTTKWKLMTKS